MLFKILRKRNHNWGKSKKGHGAVAFQLGLELQVGNTHRSLAGIHASRAEFPISSLLPGPSGQSSSPRHTAPHSSDVFHPYPLRSGRKKTAGYVLRPALKFLPLTQAASFNPTTPSNKSQWSGDFKAHWSLEINSRSIHFYESLAYEGPLFSIPFVRIFLKVDYLFIFCFFLYGSGL